MGRVVENVTQVGLDKLSHRMIARTHIPQQWLTPTPSWRTESRTNTGPTKEVVRSERKTATKARQAATPSQRQSPEDVSDSPRTGDGSRLRLPGNHQRMSRMHRSPCQHLTSKVLLRTLLSPRSATTIERHGLDVATMLEAANGEPRRRCSRTSKTPSPRLRSSSSTPLPLNCNEKVVLSLKDRQRVGFRTHLDACVKSLGKDSDASIALENLLKASVSATRYA